METWASQSPPAPRHACLSDFFVCLTFVSRWASTDGLVPFGSEICKNSIDHTHQDLRDSAVSEMLARTAFCHAVANSDRYLFPLSFTANQVNGSGLRCTMGSQTKTEIQHQLELHDFNSKLVFFFYSYSLVTWFYHFPFVSLSLSLLLATSGIIFIISLWNVINSLCSEW